MSTSVRTTCILNSIFEERVQFQEEISIICRYGSSSPENSGFAEFRMHVQSQCSAHQTFFADVLVTVILIVCVNSPPCPKGHDAPSNVFQFLVADRKDRSLSGRECGCHWLPILSAPSRCVISRLLLHDLKISLMHIYLLHSCQTTTL